MKAEMARKRSPDPLQAFFHEVGKGATWAVVEALVDKMTDRPINSIPGELMIAA